MGLLIRFLRSLSNGLYKVTELIDTALFNYEHPLKQHHPSLGDFRFDQEFLCGACECSECFYGDCCLDCQCEMCIEENVVTEFQKNEDDDDDDDDWEHQIGYSI